MKVILLLLATWGAWTIVEDSGAVAGSAYQRQAVAACLVLEAGGEGAAGMTAVMNVIQNRAKAEPAQYYNEVARPGQFSAMGRPNIGIIRPFGDSITTAKASPAWPLAMQIVQQAYEADLPDITSGATHFYAPALIYTPDWAVDMREVAFIGGHRFLVR